MPWLPYQRQAALGAFTLEAHRFTRAVPVFDGRCLIEPLLIRTTLFPCSRPRSTSSFGDYVCKRERRIRASTYMWVLSLRASVGVPHANTLDSSPRVSARALALE